MYTINRGYVDYEQSMLSVPESFRIGKRVTHNKNTEYVIEFNGCLYKIRAYETEILECSDVDVFEFSEAVNGAERFRIGAVLINVVFSKAVNDVILHDKIDAVSERFLEENASYDDASYVKMLALDAEKKGCKREFLDTVNESWGMTRDAVESLMSIDLD